jgi:hypothetical protein
LSFLLESADKHLTVAKCILIATLLGLPYNDPAVTHPAVVVVAESPHDHEVSCKPAHAGFVLIL